jgi:ubiquinone/menaquinone biosynthesis C-methylase UbiE
VSVPPDDHDRARQLSSQGSSADEIVAAALELAAPRPGLTWLDIGCGRGDLLRRVRDEHEPGALTGIDIVDWLDDDLRSAVDFIAAPAEAALPAAAPADRVLLVETIEHVAAPWALLERAARLVAPGGRIVVTTPNVASLRHRIELPLRGQLTSFRPDNEPHLTPALSHVIQRVLAAAGIVDLRETFAARDVVPATGGRLWPEPLRRRWPALLSISVCVSGTAPGPR